MEGLRSFGGNGSNWLPDMNICVPAFLGLSKTELILLSQMLKCATASSAEKNIEFINDPWKVRISSFRNLIYWMNGPFSWFMKSSYRLQHLHLVLMTFYQIWHNNHCIYMSTFTWKLNNNIESRYLVKKLGGLLKSMT